MASQRLRASSSDRVLACPYSLVAPRYELPRRKKTAEANEFGSLTHYWVETGRFDYTGATANDVKTLKKKIALSGIERERWWPPETGRHEVTFAFNPFTLELVMFRGKRDKADAWKKGKRWEPTRWVTGTIDWLGKRGPHKRWHVDDLKTGAWDVDVETSKQVRTYAVVPWLLDGQPYDWECDTSITQWPKYPLPDEPGRTWHVLTEMDLMEHLADIRWALSNPQIVRPVIFGPPEKDENGRYSFGEKLPHCAGCECRIPVPGISTFVTNFWYRTLPYCLAGMMKRING